MSEVSLDTAPAITINLDNVRAAVKLEESVEGADGVVNGINGMDGNQSAELDSYPEGRTTPTPESESANFLSRNPSFIASTPAESPIPSSAPSSTGAPRATIGLGPLSGEEQLKSSLTSNDRLFLLIVAKEVEAFMLKVRSGENPNIIPSIPVATNSTSALASMSASFIVGSHVSSTFQRMLVYKLAEWYGLKAVHVQDVAMIIGVVGSFDTRSLSLRLADLAPTQDTAPPKIKIMQRAQNNPPSANGSSRPGSTTTDDSQNGSSSRSKTLEEREQAYAKAKQRIYGNTTNSTPPESSTSADDASALEPPAQIVPVPVQAQAGRRAVHNDDFETAPREREDPYANYQNQIQNPYGSYGYNQQQTMPQYGYNPHMNQHIPQYGSQPQQYMAGPSYMPMYGHQPPPPQNPYAAQGQWVQVPQNYHQMPNTQWVPNPMVQCQSHQPMPVIPQGMQYPAYGYPQQPQPHQQQQQQNYGYLVQPVPMRPPPHPHSSASSSISSRSYHSYHDASRPHSRGSTTSNMSATSSVRFGNLYPANQGGGTYRQTRRKHHGVNGINAPIGEGSDRRERDHSPASRSNGSSHSSRRPESINLIPPSQHPLPQRPDWAANNIQYHPSPVSQTQSQSQSPGQSPTDFPPLRQGGGTHAEPMQVERTKMRPLNGTAWNGVKLGITSPISDHAAISPRMSVSAPVSAVPTVPAPSTPRESATTIPPIETTPQVPIQILAPNTVREPKSKSSNGERESKSKSADEDFPRRPPNSAQLYNPNPTPSPMTKPTIEEMIPGKIPAEVIEAKLAAISIKEGVTIGPPANKKVASYAKIVRRD